MLYDNRNKARGDGREKTDGKCWHWLTKECTYLLVYDEIICIIDVNINRMYSVLSENTEV